MSSKSNGTGIFIPEAATILKNEPMTENENFFEIKFDSGRELGHKCGQFVEVTVPGFGEAPISVSSSPLQKGSFELGVRKMGNVTRAMHKLKPGDKIGIRGPYGTSFPVDTVMKGKDVVFISGGCGLVPVRSAIRYTLEKRKDYGNITILFGCKSTKDRLYVQELESWGSRKDVTLKETVDLADEKWTGNVGVITTLLSQIKITDIKNTIVIVCGPPVMYKFVLWDLKAANLPDNQIFISLERRMKCGLGKCGHCQVNGLYACQDGPVFNYADLGGVREAIE